MKASTLIRLALGAACVALLANCAANPVTGRQNFVMMSEADEIQTGRKADADVRKEYGVYDNAELQRYVNEVGQRLAQKSHRSNLSYRFTVVDSPEINAFALPGGYIYITRGIMAYLNSEAELAAVLSHEIGHVTARHGVQQYSAAMATSIGVALGSVLVPELRSQVAQNLLDLLGNAFISGYGRDHELEADRLGAEYLARAGYDPQAMVRVIGILKNQELFDTEIARQEGRAPRAYHGVFASHPDNDTRLKEVVGEANRYAQGARDDRRMNYLNQIDRLVFGDSPQQGTLRGNAFLHDELGFALHFPQDWRVHNSPDKVRATSPGGDATLELQVNETARGAPAEILRQTIRPNPGHQIETDPINQLPAAVLTGVRQGNPVKAGAIRLGEKTFLMVGSAKSAALFKRHQDAMAESIHSFHEISRAERRQARPLALRTQVADRNTRFAALAKLSPLGKNAEAYLRLMNNAYPSGEPQAGQPLKIVE